MKRIMMLVCAVSAFSLATPAAAQLLATGSGQESAAATGDVTAVAGSVAESLVEDTCLEITVRNRTTGEVDFYDSCSNMECPSSLCGALAGSSDARGIAYYNDYAEAAEITAVHAANSGNPQGANFRLAVTRAYVPDGSEEGLPGVGPIGPIGPPKCPDPTAELCEVVEGVADGLVMTTN